METLASLKAGGRPYPVPDVSKWTNKFTDWGIWTDAAGADRGLPAAAPEPGLGLALLEGRVATTRILGWMVVFAALGLVLMLLANVVPSGGFICGAMSLACVGLALYRVLTWYLNRDLRVKIFREGFSLTRGGETCTVHWRDVDTVREQWMKVRYQGIIQINTHNLDVYTVNGQRIGMDRSLDEIERIGRLIQTAVAHQKLPGAVERLTSDGICEFGPFQMSRYGIAYRGTHALHWSEVGSLKVDTVGEITVKFHKPGSKWWSAPWATEKGGAVPNLRLFLWLADWFVSLAQQPNAAKLDTVALPVGPLEEDEAVDVQYQLFITKKEAQQGVNKTLFAGPAKREQRLVVKIPPGVKSGTVYHFPGYGRPDPKTGAAGNLHVEVIAETSIPFGARLNEFQIVAGMLGGMFGLMWINFWSTLDLFASLVLSAVVGLVAGILMATSKRWAGAVSGLVGGVSCFLVQTLYVVGMYILFDRESFWDLELAIVLMVGLLPGLGLYMWLTTGKLSFR